MGPRNRNLGHKALAAMQLHAGIDHLALQVSAPVLGHRGGLGIELALQQLLQTAVDNSTSDADLGLQFGKHEAGVPKVRDGLAEGASAAHLLDRHAIGVFRGSGGRDCDLQPLPRQLLHQIGKAAPLLAQSVVGGHHDSPEAFERASRLRRGLTHQTGNTPVAMANLYMVRMQLQALPRP